MAIIITGKVLVRSGTEKTIPAPNVRVEAWDTDLFDDDDPLGEAVTNSEGEFTIPVDPDAEADEIFLSPRIDPYFRVYGNNVEILFTERGAWDAGGEGEDQKTIYTTLIKVAAHDVQPQLPVPVPGGGDPSGNGSGSGKDGENNEVLRNLRYLVAYQPTPRDTGGMGVRRASEIETTVSDALRDVLGKSIRRKDGRALQGVLDHVFKFEMVEGHRQVRFQAPNYTVTTDFGTELSGPQKSLYTLIDSMGSELRKRIDIIRPLKIASDSERTEPDRNGWLIELEEMVATIRNSITLRPLRLDGAFERLEEYRLAVEKSFGFARNKLGKNIQSIDDEQNYTEFINATQFQSAMQRAWENFKTENNLSNKRKLLPAAKLNFYDVEDTPVLLGTRMALLEELLTVVYESVDEVYNDLNALGIEEDERRVIKLAFEEAPFKGQEITVAELFDWVAAFSKTKAPRILKDGGRSALHILYAEVERLADLVDSMPDTEEASDVLLHPRVQRSIEALQGHLEEVQEQLDAEPTAEEGLQQ